jgi:glycosyltransferase involved in cell wall biosynthesis
MNVTLPNPVSPAPSTFLSRLRHSRSRFRELETWTPDTGYPKSGQPMVSIMLITYNHEKFVAQAIDSILMQVRDFDIEINVIDDASTDRTQEIVREYAVRYSGLINCYFNPVNAGHIATQLNTIRGFRTLRGRYFSLLEGDDYWTHPYKLARQVNFLERFPEFVASAHYTRKVYDDNSRPPEHFLPFEAFGRKRATIHDLITMAGVFHLSSIVYRNVFELNPPLCLADPASCEVTINMVYGCYGDFYCIEEYMSEYRVHGSGIFSGRSQESHWLFHLRGFRRFSLYLGSHYWNSFFVATRGFSRYVLIARMRGVVKHLSLKSYLTFTVHFLVATLLRALYVLASKLPFQSDVAGSITKRKPAALQRKTISQMMYTGLIKILPDDIIHAYLKFESKFPSFQGKRRKLTSSIARPHRFLN